MAPTESASQSGMERIDWFYDVDYEILKYFYEYSQVEAYDFETTPTLVARALDYDRSYVSREMSILSDVGVLGVRNTSAYSLTELGRRIVESDIDEDDIPADPRGA